MARRHRRGRCRERVDAELELMPMLNVFISIIPLLLLSAAFVPVSVIQASLPGSGAAVAAAKPERPAAIEIFIRRETYLVVVNGSAVRTVAREAAATATAELAAALKSVAAAHRGERELRIVSEPSTRYLEIVRVMDLARAAGLPEASLVEAGEAS